MSKQFWNFGSAWYGKKNPDNISVIVGDEKSPVEIVAVHKETGEQIKLTNFFLKRNTSKDAPDANPNWPDFQLTFTTGE